MTAFRAILAWELRTGLGRVSTWVYFGVYLLLTMLIMLTTAGAWSQMFGGPGGGGNVLANSPYSLSSLIPVIALIGTSITAAIAGNALHRDYEAGIEPLLYTTPITRGAFLGGRFAGALLVNLVVLLGIGLGAALAAGSPMVKPEMVGSFDPVAYLSPYLTFVIPNVLLTAAIFFALVSLTRQMMAVYVGGVVLLIGYLISGALMGDLENKRFAALLDPFGLRAQSLATEYWSVVERNYLYVPFEGVILWNRLIWIGVGLALFGLAYYRFRFAHSVGEQRAGRAEAAAAAGRDDAIVVPAELFLTRVLPHELPRVTRRFDARAQWTQFHAVFTAAFNRIVRARSFLVLMIAALGFTAVTAREAGRMFGTPTWPVTYHMTELLLGTIGGFMIVLVAIYAGELVWAERDSRSNQISDASPVPTYVLYPAKLMALVATMAVIFAIMLVSGVVIQAIKGYYRFEIPLYVQSFFGVYFVDMVLTAALAVTIHVFSNHKAVGHLLVILTFVLMAFLPTLGFERNLYMYGGDSNTVYSDMNGWGPFLGPFLWWKAYWLAFVAVLLVVTNMFWVRGEETRLRLRARLARGRFGRGSRMVTAAGTLAFAALGGFLYYNTDHVNIFRTSKENRRLVAEREKLYKQYESAPQPRITAVTVRVDLEPRRRAMAVAGAYVLRNKTGVPIDTIHLGISEMLTIRSLTFDGGAERLLADSLRDYHMYRLAAPLPPGDSTVMRFELARRERGIPNKVGNLSLVENGTFLSSAAFMPVIGYSEAMELPGDDARSKEGLPPKRMRPPTDPDTRRNNYISGDADWIAFDATVSTDPDQVAIIPGYLQREWTENGRRLFHYTMDAPILNFWAVLSARYAVKRDRWRDVEIAVYHHPSHTYNLDRMIASVQKSLDYFTEQFGPYQHRQVRIAEFPRYASFAQSLPNLIPYSEAIGFIARVERDDDVDYPFYITAHEVAHDWWAHQVVGADASGSTMLSETLAEYSSLMVMEKEYGAVNMRKFLAYELDTYLMSRAGEQKREMPLQLVENQPYIHYNKGALVMYALRDYIGEERVNRVLREFLASAKYQGPPYPTSLELVDRLRAATPDSLKYLITDLFETITFYELKTDSATARPVDSTRYVVDLWIDASKHRSDSLGVQREIPMADWIDIGVFADPPRGVKKEDRNGIPLYLRKHLVESGKQHVRIEVDRKPIRVGIDPLQKLIDRLSRDNVTGVRERERRSASYLPPPPQIRQKAPLSLPVRSTRPWTYTAFIMARGAYLISSTEMPSAASSAVTNTLPKWPSPSACPLSCVMIE